MKVKNIMFSGFAAAILMGVAAEANAATKVVASKGYVDAITGQITGLNGSAEGATNLVSAINTKLGEVAPVTGALTDGEYYSSVTQTAQGQVAVSKGTLATEIEDGVMKAPTTDAVHSAITSLDYESTADATDNANLLTDGYAVSYVSQVDGKVKIGAKQYNDTVSAAVAEGANGVHAPSTKAVWNAIQGVSGQTTNLNLDQVGGDGKYVKYVKQANGQVAAEEGTIDTEMSRDSTNPVTNAAITTALSFKQDILGTNQMAAVNSGITAGKVEKYDSYATTKQDKLEAGNFVKIEDGKITTTYSAGDNITIDQTTGEISTKFPEMPAACTASGVTCVLTSENGAFAWAILTQPYTYTSGDVTDEESIARLGDAAQKQKIPEQLYTQQ